MWLDFGDDPDHDLIQEFFKGCTSERITTDQFYSPGGSISLGGGLCCACASS